MNIIENIKNRVKKDIKTIVLPESDDIRTLQAAETIKKEGFANILLIGKIDNIHNLAVNNGIDISGIDIIEPENFTDKEILINTFYELRKNKGITLEEARNLILNNYLYFGCMLVKLNYADGQVSGATHSTADTLRPALQIIKAKENTKLVSSFTLMEIPNCEYGENGVFVFSDCGLNQNPTSEELVEIAKSSAETFSNMVEKEPYVALLSHSTYGTSKCSDVDKITKATLIAKEVYPALNLDGELQLDSAIIPEVASKKAPTSKIAGKANVLIFPDLDAGNIGCKLVERLAKAKAYGPITQGLAKPINDLSRGCNADDIVGAVAITALQAQSSK